MTFRTLAAGLLLVATTGEVWAQPIAPPRRPTFQSYQSLYSPGAAFYGYGYGGPGYGFNPYGYGGGGAAQQALVLQQLNQTNQAVASLQQFLAYGTNPTLAPTGRGATFNSLGHWYPNARGSGGAMVGGGGGSMTGPPPGQGLGAGGLAGAAATGAATANAFGGGGGGGAPRTSGNGIPVGQPRR